MAHLIAFAGPPGAGKSTIARQLARETGAVYLRIDEIDAAIWARDPGRDIGPESYHIAAALAVSNLGLGHDVITDCVNPWPITRAIFAEAATRAGAELLGVEITCSDRALHRARLAARGEVVAGLAPLDWDEAEARDYRPWAEAALHLDSARLSVEAAVATIRRALSRR